MVLITFYTKINLKTHKTLSLIITLLVSFSGAWYRLNEMPTSFRYREQFPTEKWKWFSKKRSLSVFIYTYCIGIFKEDKGRH
jgi:hypothetical protein